VVNPRPSWREPVPTLPEGFRYRSDMISPTDEDALLARLRELPFREFEFHGYTGSASRS
jgi:hypothetical protein